jgi:spore germination protein YaaH
MLVINQLHKSSSIILLIIRFYEHVSTNSNPSLIYLRLLQASFGGYISSITTTNNSEYQQRWSAFIYFQLPRILSSCLETQFDSVKKSIETFLLHNEYLLNRMDELCIENTFEKFFQITLKYIKNEIRDKYNNQINQLCFYIQQIRRNYIEQIQHHYQNHQTR